MNKEMTYPTDLPKAKIHKQRWRFSFIWVVPVVAALVAGVLVLQRAREFGSTITIKFRDVEGVKPGQTPVRYRGAEIGQVTTITLAKDEPFALVKVKLRRTASWVAREDSSFWIVRPRVTMGNLTGLGTLISGPYIGVQAGQGKPASHFDGSEHSPTGVDRRGLRVVLLAEHSGSLHAGVPIYYRGIEVGSVLETHLSTNSASVEIHCIIRRRYAPLVRPETKFWNVTGVDVRVGLFRGAEVNVESLKSLLIGGIAFATPDVPGSTTARDGTLFRLYESAEKDWTHWAPRIPISNDEPDQIDSTEIDIPQPTLP